MKSEKINVKKTIITDLNKILSEHVPLQYWDRIKSEISPRYKSPVAVLIEIPDEEVNEWYEKYTEMIRKRCQKALAPFYNRRKETAHIYIDFGGAPKWLQLFSENNGSWFEMLCEEVYPEWDYEPHNLAYKYKHIPFDYWPNLEDALDRESTKQGLHICVIFCFAPKTLRSFPPVGKNRWWDRLFNEEDDDF